MAKFNKNEGGLTFKPEPPPKKTRKIKRRPRIDTFACEACGLEASSRTKQGYSMAKNGKCHGCAGFFGIIHAGVTNLDHETVIGRLDRVREDKHVIILKSGSFVDGTSGDSMGVDFGDIFPVARVGTTTKPTGDIKDAMERFTIDVLVNNRPLKLLPHEFAEIPWVTIMLYRKEKDYIEAYLSGDDKTGYFAPSKEVKAEIINAYGDR